MVRDPTEPDVDEFGFKRFAGNFVFIACSGDLEPERIAVERAIRDEIRELGQGNVHVFSWDTQTGPGGLDQRRSMQRNIPRPSADNCLGVIYLVGERLGQPLERGSYGKFLGASRDWIGKDPHPLRLDWPDDGDAARALLDQGAFPLTGGVFEFLSARGHRDAKYPEGKPVYMAIFADREVRPDGGEVTLNRNRWFSEETRDMTRAQRRRWEDAEGDPQTAGVHNFLRACARERIAQHLVNEPETLVKGVRSFVRGMVFGQRSDSGNPYRELRYYDVQHGHFYGRRDFVKRVVDRLDGRLADPRRVAACCITGHSGAGKSSVLRAGILRELDDPTHRGRYRWMVLRPELFKDQAGADISVIDTVLDELETQAGIELAAATRRSISRAGANAPMEAARAVIGAFRRSRSGAEWLVLALDQFEEIVDELASTRRREHWQPLLRFLEAVFEHPGLGLLYTLESSRVEQYERLKLPEPFRSAFVEELDDGTQSNIEDIISLPFAKTGFPLADEVIRELGREFSRLRDEDSRAARNSALPLLALKLHALWDFVAAHFEPTHVVIGADAGMGSSSEKIDLESLIDGGQKLDFASVIDELATKAWRRAEVGQVDGEKLGHFLRPLVGVEGGYVQLAAAPREAPYADEQKLIKSFRKRRLLLDVGDGLVRLVHQAVLDHWKEAAKWLGRSRTSLEGEAAMRDEARHWDNGGRRAFPFPDPALEARISAAVEMLVAFMRSWSFGETTVRADDRALRAYCIALFERSTTPSKPARLGEVTVSSYVHYAAAYGLVGLLQRFTDGDPGCAGSFTSEDPGARRPLHAASWAHIDAVRLLLDRGADPIAKTKDGWPPVLGAVSMGRMDIFEALMERAAGCANGRSLEELLLCPGDGTLVHHAAGQNRVDMLRELLDRYGFSAFRRDGNGGAPIHFAAAAGSLAAFDFLRERCGIEDRIPSEEWTCLHVAAMEGHRAIVDRILGLPGSRALSCAKSSSGWTALHYAAARHHADCTAALLRNGLDPGERAHSGDTAIQLALKGLPSAENDLGSALYDEKRAIATLRVLLADARADPDAKDRSGRSPLDLAERDRALLREILKHPRIDLRQRVRDDGDTGIFLAAREGIWSVVQRFIDEFGLPDGTETDREGNTFLHHLTARTAPPNLLRRSIDQVTREQLEARNKKGQTPFHRALVARNWSLARRMLETSLLALHEGDEGWKWELWIALEAGAPQELLKRLADALGPRLAEPDGDGWTLLHHVAAANDARWCQALAKAADLGELWRIEDRQGRRPIDLCGPRIAALASKDLEPARWPEPIVWDHGVDWKPVAGDAARRFIAKAGLEGVDAEGWDMARGTLSFYPGTSIVRLERRGNGRSLPVIYHLEDGDTPCRLDGRSPPIHAFNAKHLKLTIDCVRNYLHFFCFFVRGNEGPFFVLENPERAILSATTSEADRASIAELAMPAWLIGQREGRFRLLARVYYSNALFTAYFDVLEKGMVEMMDDVPVLRDLSGGIDMPVA